MFPWVSEQMSRASEASEGVSIAKGSAVQQTSEKTSGPFYTMPFSLSQIIVQVSRRRLPFDLNIEEIRGTILG